ncbi:MAG: diacylglycerol kinase [Treponema sp.]|jgi:diacylglycerol kinase family enzyme|nr:diacylglycerol kinase [Treponema sp.]
MDLEFFADGVSGICAHSPVAPGRALRWTIIANPTAGGFTIGSRWKRHHRALVEYREKAAALPPRENSGASEAAKKFAPNPRFSACGFIPTTGPGHGRKITEAVIEEAASGIRSEGSAAPFHLIVTSGGDGTSLEALSALYNAPAALRGNVAILRFPMGTGNDGADAEDLPGALELLVNPVRLEYARALRLLVSPEGPARSKGPFLAFNILSVGLDAFVTHMTNKMKGKLPGDSYKLWVDIASLLYDRLYKVDFLEVRALDEQKREITAFREKLLLLAVGSSGHRTYGSRKKILPDYRNVCAVRQMPLYRKLLLKGLFTTGAHIHKPESILFNAHRVEFSGSFPLLAQMDGETVLLQKEDFPAAIELADPVIPVLKLGAGHGSP